MRRKRKIHLQKNGQDWNLTVLSQTILVKQIKMIEAKIITQNFLASIYQVVDSIDKKDQSTTVAKTKEQEKFQTSSSQLTNQIKNVKMSLELFDFFEQGEGSVIIFWLRLEKIIGNKICEELLFEIEPLIWQCKELLMRGEDVSAVFHLFKGFGEVISKVSENQKLSEINLSTESTGYSLHNINY